MKKLKVIRIAINSDTAELENELNRCQNNVGFIIERCMSIRSIFELLENREPSIIFSESTDEFFVFVWNYFYGFLLFIIIIPRMNIVINWIKIIIRQKIKKNSRLWLKIWCDTIWVSQNELKVKVKVIFIVLVVCSICIVIIPMINTDSILIEIILMVVLSVLLISFNFRKIHFRHIYAATLCVGFNRQAIIVS